MIDGAVKDYLHSGCPVNVSTERNVSQVQQFVMKVDVYVNRYAKDEKMPMIRIITCDEHENTYVNQKVNS